jgi:hypothetical protein
VRDKLEAVFDADWNLVELSRNDEVVPDVLPERPETLTDMIAAAGRLGAGLDFARIDLYDEADGIVLGEITIYPQAGVRGTPTLCPRFNRWLGDEPGAEASGRLVEFLVDCSGCVQVGEITGSQKVQPGSSATVTSQQNTWSGASVRGNTFWKLSAHGQNFFPPAYQAAITDTL